MPILTILLALICAGIVLHCVNAYLPMDASFKRLLNIVVIGVTVVWLLKVFGILHMLAKITV